MGGDPNKGWTGPV